MKCNITGWLTCLFLATAIALGGGTIAARAGSPDDTAAQLAAVEKENALLRLENAALRERVRLQAENTELNKRLQHGGSSEAQAQRAPSILADNLGNKPLYMSTQPVTPPYSWTGLYAGGNLGYGWGNNNTVNFLPNDPTQLGGFIGAGGPTSLRASSLLGGFQLGYNWQFNQAWLAGVETDIDFLSDGGNGSSTNGALANPTNLLQQSVNEQVTWFGTVRGRFGYLPTNNLLVYGTGGFAYGRIEQNATYSNLGNNTFASTDGFCAAGTTCYAGTSTHTATGWAAGGGLEYALTNNVTIRGEYLYVDLGGGHTTTETVLNNGTPNPPSTIAATFGGTSFQVVRAGGNVKF